MSPNLFCPNLHFKKQIVGVLNSSLFSGPFTNLSGTATSVNSISDIYSDMQKYADCPDIAKLYMIDVKGLASTLRNRGLCKNGFLYAGHDLPIWINDPESCECRVMIVGLSPRRNSTEMYDFNIPSTNQISVSSPFGMHMRYHRRRIDIIPKVVLGLIECAEAHHKKMSVYLTDLYKMRRANSSVNNKINKNAYQNILKEEIDIFKPCMVILLGKQAMDDLGVTGSYFLPKSTLFGKYSWMAIPHPSGNNNQVIEDEKRNKNSSKPTVDFLRDEICKQLNYICYDK